MRTELERLTDKVSEFIANGEEREERFESLALELFDFQFQTIAPYRRLCEQKGATPAAVTRWHEIPSVPADAFKHFSLFAGASDDVVKTFRSSGTSGRERSRALFSEAGLGLMRQSVESNAARYLFPDGRVTRIVVLAPEPRAATESIMAWGMWLLVRRFGLADSASVFGHGEPDRAALAVELRRALDDGVPLTLMGSSFAFVNVMDAMEREGDAVVLPHGSRLMDAGGYKGRSAEIDRNEFAARVRTHFGIEPKSVVNLLGLTELASQFYDGHYARSAIESGSHGGKRPPAWARTMLVDPRKLEGSDGYFVDATARRGVLRHLDLANVERPQMIQTEDVGVLRRASRSRPGEGVAFDILGRCEGAEPRGCSLSVGETEAPATPHDLGEWEVQHESSQ